MVKQFPTNLYIAAVCEITCSHKELRILVKCKGSVVRYNEKCPQLYFRKAVAEQQKFTMISLSNEFDLDTIFALIHTNSNIFLIYIRDTRIFF